MVTELIRSRPQGRASPFSVRAGKNSHRAEHRPPGLWRPAGRRNLTARIPEDADPEPGPPLAGTAETEKALQNVTPCNAFAKKKTTRAESVGDITTQFAPAIGGCGQFSILSKQSTETYFTLFSSCTVPKKVPRWPSGQ